MTPSMLVDAVLYDCGVSVDDVSDEERYAAATRRVRALLDRLESAERIAAAARALHATPTLAPEWRDRLDALLLAVSEAS